jgi:hypothetical protein
MMSVMTIPLPPRVSYMSIYMVCVPSPEKAKRQLTGLQKGLHAEEAVEHLSNALRQHENAAPMRPVYAITGTGHHSRHGKDKIGKAVRAFLAEWRYAFREFSGPGDRNGMGGVIGIDPTSWDRSLDRESVSKDVASAGGSLLIGQSTKVMILRKEHVDATTAIVEVDSS